MPPPRGRQRGDRAAEQSARALSLRLFTAMLATQEMLTIYLGVRLGLYEALANGWAVTPNELSARLALDPRYLREWLEQQAVAGLLLVEDVEEVEDERRYRLSKEHREVLLKSDSPMSMVALTCLPLGGVAQALPHLLDAFASGAGVPDDLYGEDWRHGHSGANLALFTGQLAPWLALRMPDVTRRLSAPQCRVADVCCGAGWAGIALAQAFPALSVQGFDIDADTLSLATRHATETGVGNRVAFREHDVRTALPDGPYDLLLLLDSIHEISNPVDVLRSARSSVREDGTVLILEARVAEVFSSPGDEIERFQYATSVLHCLPAGRIGPDTYPTGTALRPAIVHALAFEAGFRSVAEVPSPDRFHRTYRLTP